MSATSPARAPAASIQGWALAILVALAVLATTWGRMQGNWLPAIGNDGYQYLSVAENANAGHLGYTSLVHFDAERRFGVLPAPMVTFPSGFPLLMAAVSHLGLDLKQAALLINLCAGMAVVLVLFWTGRRLGWSLRTSLLLAACYAINSQVLNAAAAVLTEPLSTLLLTLGACMLLVMAADERDDGPASTWIWQAVCGGLLIGLAYYVRYAALFVLVGLWAAAAWSWLRRRRPLALRMAVAGVAAAIPMALGMLRNIQLAGSWRGGNDKHVVNSVVALAKDSLLAIDDLMLGRHGVDNATWLHLVFFALLAVGLAALAMLPRRRRGNSRAVPHQAALEVAVVIAGAYCACMVYAGLFSVISYGARMFLPVLPLLALIVTWLLRLVWPADSPPRSQPFASGWIAALLLVYLGAQATADGHAIPQAKNSELERIVRGEVKDGVTAESVVHGLVAGDRAMLANEGQALGQILSVPTVSMVSLEYSSIPWDDNLVREVVQRFRIGAIVVKRPHGADADNTNLLPSPLVMQWASLQHPAWMTVRWVSDDLVVYSVAAQP